MKVNSFETINSFVKEIFGFELSSNPDTWNKIRYFELIKTRNSIVDIVKNGFHKEARFLEDVLPLLEVAVQWVDLKEKEKFPAGFVEKCKERMNADSSNFQGIVFEIDMATRCLLSGWDVAFLEAKKYNNANIMDLLIHKGREITGLECESKRATKNLNITKLFDNIVEKSQKFSDANLKAIGIKLDKRILVIDITRGNYTKPAFLANIIGSFSLPPELDAVVLTWRELSESGRGKSMVVKYHSIGNVDNKYYTASWRGELVFQPVCFFVRKYVEPEPRIVHVGPEEKSPFFV